MLTALLDEAQQELDAARKKFQAKFDEYMLAPVDEHGDEREQAMETAWSDYQRAEGVVAGLERAAHFLNARLSA